MVLEGKDPASASMRDICRMNNVDRSEDMDMLEGITNSVLLACDKTGHHQVAAGTQHVMDSISENEAEMENGTCQENEAVIGEDLPRSEMVLKTRDGLENKRKPPKVGDEPFNVEGNDSENIDPSS